MRLLKTLALVLVLVILLLPMALAAQTPAPDVGAQLSLLLAGVLGLIGGGATEVLKRIVQKIAGVDAEITEYTKKVQPLIALGFAMLAPRLHFLHGVLPSGDVFAAAPLGVTVFIAVRELVLKWFPSLASAPAGSS